MENIYAVKTAEELRKYQEFVAQIQTRLSEYINFLEQEYQVCDLPKTIVWTNKEIATNLISDIPIPAYTNDFRIVITPDIDSWRSIYLRQLDSLKDNKKYAALYKYYNEEISTNHILQILGHELAHHSTLFLDDFYSSASDGIWFEEGMVEYISRRYFLSEDEYEKEYEINRVLVDSLKDKYGTHSLEEFGFATYEGDYASIFYEYWRSFIAIHQIVKKYNGDVKEVFASYHRWNEAKEKTTLLEWFEVE